MAWQHRNPLVSPSEEAMTSPSPPELARTQVLCWLHDELLDAEDDLLALAARPEALSDWRRERLAAALTPGGPGGGAAGLGGAGGGVRAKT